MGGAWKLTILLTVALACALGISACGGSSSTSSTASTEAATTSGSEESTAQSNGGQQGGSTKEGSSKGGGAEEEESHRHVSATEEARSQRFKVKGGDNSIPEYGQESTESERGEATKLLTTFFKIERSGEDAKLCGLLSAKNLESIEAITKQEPKLKGKKCGAVLEMLIQHVQEKPPYTPKTAVISVRTEKGTGFALYVGMDGKNYAFPMTREGGSWKLTALAPTPMG